MPIYEFECASCGEAFEVILDMGEAPPSCPACGDSECRKLIGAPAVHVKVDHATGRESQRLLERWQNRGRSAFCGQGRLYDQV
ncbi:MAG: zinc ribbon domain-containing protein [Deltaproteobacteria bacterium]|nr:zinc ribbon domain-containing protein [Deltaproteobacteria bacterium]